MFHFVNMAPAHTSSSIQRKNNSVKWRLESRSHYISLPIRKFRDLPVLGCVQARRHRSEVIFLMERYYDKLSSQIASIHSELKANGSKLTLGDISQTKEKFESIILELRDIHNFKISVNRLAPCALEHVFALATFGSPGPETTILKISHVCRQWRELALGWPILWAFVSPDSLPPPLVELFIARSGDAPLTMSWTKLLQEPSSVPDVPAYSNPFAKFEYLKSHNESILYRLQSLTLHFSGSRFDLVQDVFYTSRMLPLVPLRYLDICGDGSKQLSIKNILHINVSVLQELKLSYINWSWFGYPHPNLTYIKLYNPPEPPSLPTVLTFLSNCPLLKELEYCVDDAIIKIPINVTASPPSVSVNKFVDLPNLERIRLVSEGSWSCNYIQGILTRLVFSMRLSQFQLVSHNRNPPIIFVSVPYGIFSHFSNHFYLSVGLDIGSGLVITSAPNREGVKCSLNPPLCISGSTPRRDFFAGFQKLIREMPQITHLELTGDAWKIFSFPDFRHWFPCLHIVEMTSFRPSCNINEVVNMLRNNGPKVEGLILDLDLEHLPFGILLDIFRRTGAKFLQVDEITLCKKPGIAEIIAALPKGGVETIKYQDS